uniref:Uncharacterized protein n=1 Tax=Marseillevirus LCMAC102 TaxID=2506603 RepID=A0A481YUZ9_9VIRU|nr:MAG: uncharacterized protein LCMAC102_01690 [Marseillevirus LCMAC102]
MNIRGNWLFYLIAVLISVILLYLLAKSILNISRPPPEDTFYYKITDEEGIESIIHDSGIKPSETPPGSYTNIQILKKEINNGVSQNLAWPEIIKLGMHPKHLEWKLTPKNIIEDDLYYIVTILIPDLYSPTEIKDE